MTDYLTSFFTLFFSPENQLLTLFVSGFLSATLLPGNSEIIFSALVSQSVLETKTFFAMPIANLVWVATLGNSLGSLATYAMGMLVPKPINTQKPYAKWALEKSEKYGAVMLLLSWLPVVGDLLCGIAGWLRFPFWASFFFIALGKFLRYLILLAGLYPVLKYVL